MNILVRLPNWLGDAVMSIGFIHALHDAFPAARIDCIIKKELYALVSLFPFVHTIHTFSKETHPGLRGILRCGASMRRTAGYDLFFTLPSSLSSIIMGYCSGARVRVGFKREWGGFLLTKRKTKPSHAHRVSEYLSLLDCIGVPPSAEIRIHLPHPTAPIPLEGFRFPEKKYFIVHAHSEAPSRRLPVQSALAIVTALQKEWAFPIVLTGSRKEYAYTEKIIQNSGCEADLHNMAGRTDLKTMLYLIAQSACIISTDCGIAHLANSLAHPCVVLFGAGNEKNTGPFNKDRLSIIRKAPMSCTPCVENTCTFGAPKCLEDVPVGLIIDEVRRLIKSEENVK